MMSKLLETKQGPAVLLPADALEILGLTIDSEISVALNPELGQIIVTPTSLLLPGVDEEFAQQVSDFIEQYRPALKALVK